jgi:tetratricopeptide (TPR) repeat protein
MKRAVLALAALVVGGGAAAAQTLDACRALKRHGKTDQANGCFEKLFYTNDPYIRAESAWALGRHNDANEAFKRAVAAHPKNAAYRVRWGRLLLERFNKTDSADLFREALIMDEKNADAVLGLALVASDGFESKAVEMAEKAASLNPKLAEAHELLASLALEDSNPEKAIEEADKAIAIDPESLDAMAIRATIDLMNDQPRTPWLSKIAAINPVYGQAYSTAGRFFVINRRYEEGIELYRQALKLDNRLWEARSELGINLMRLGHDEEARQHLEAAYENGYRNAATSNSLKLLDSYKNFEFFEQGNLRIKIHKKEAELLRPYVEDEVRRAVATYEKKYQLKLAHRVQVELYPDHEDFAVRTMGLPGLGALGVTFGYVVAMDSPSGRKAGSFHWASTLWHELSHVYVLAATKHRVPRWFTEGMAVHEETAASPEWGDRLDPEALTAMQQKKLLPVAQLDRGFIRPSYPSQVPVSYFQAGRICDYIAGKWGYQKLLDMMNAFGARKTTPEVIEAQLGMKPEDFDREFFAWLDGQTKKQVEGFTEWRKRVRGVSELAKAKNYDGVIKEGLAIRDIYPDYVEAGSVYEFLADAYLAKGDKKSAAEQLGIYARTGGRSPLLLKRLADLLEEQGNKKEAAAALDRINYIAPVADEELHRKLGDLLASLGDKRGSIREYRALVASKPADVAGAQFRLAQAYRENKQLTEAREHLLLALEEAPGYRPAQKMLLELSHPTQEKN